MSSDAARTILLAEDNDALRSVAREILTEAGYRVLEASDGIQLVRLASAVSIDGLLLDIRLGADDGISLGREIREMHPDLPIALLSGDSSEPTAMKRALGLTDHFLSKPFTAEELTSAVAGLVDRN